jgi:DNA-binding PadR family transcriptional regulator
MPILRILSPEPAHGYGIAQGLEQISQSAVQVKQGSLCLALHRPEQNTGSGFRLSKSKRKEGARRNSIP